MKVLPRKDEGDDDCHRLSFSVRTNEFADAFYKVRTNITSVVDRTFSKSIRYVKSQNEGKTKREIEVLFDYDAGKASYLNQSVWCRPYRFHPKSLTHCPLPIFFAWVN